MLLPLVATLMIGAADHGPRPASDPLLTSGEAVCLATGFCSVPDQGRGGASPGGPMYLAIGLVATGITVLRTDRRRPRRREP